MNVQRPEGESPLKFFAKNVLSASFAAMTAEVFTIPLDTAKVRLQIQSKATTDGAKPKYSGFMGTMATISREEGPRALLNGLSAGL